MSSTEPLTARCQECGAAIASNAASGLCPQCLRAQECAGKGTNALNVEGSGGRPPRSFGDYELIEEIARGAMGVVFRARQISLRREVALKMILAGELATPESVKRFRREAELAARLHHPHIVAVYQVGTHGSQHFFAMRLVAGRQDIATWTKALTLPPAARAVQMTRMMAKVARAVSFAHEQGVLHRDLKPSNILVDEKGEPCIVDFGISRALHGDADFTLTSQTAGTPRYMAPEQARGDSQALTPSVDIYSLGAIFYELLSGRKIFDAADLLTLLEQIVESPPAPLRIGQPALEGIVFRCLQKTSAARYGSAAEFADDLERWLRGETVQAQIVDRESSVWKWLRPGPAQYAFGGLAAGATVLLVFFLSDGAKMNKQAGDAAAGSTSQVKTPGKAAANIKSIPSAFQPDDRRAIEWLHGVLSTRGFLQLRDEDDKAFLVTSSTSIPSGDFVVTELELADAGDDRRRLPLSSAQFRRQVETLRQLEHCFLFNLEFTVAELGFLSNNPYLEQIHIEGLPVGDNLIPLIGKLKNLSFLHICNNLDLGHQLTGHNLGSLESLPLLILADFQNTHFDDTGAAILGDNCPELRRLRIEGTRITDAALRSISKLELEDLKIGRNPALTDAGLASLAKIRAIKELNIIGCPNLTEAGIAAFQDAHPACQIVR